MGAGKTAYGRLTITLILVIVVGTGCFAATAVPTPVATEAAKVTVTPAPTTTPIPLPTPTVGEIPLPTATRGSFPGTSGTGRQSLEVSSGTEVTDTDLFGEINVEYPIRLSAGSSDVVRVLIQRPPELASVSPVSFERITIPPDAPPIIGELEAYRATILIQNQMRLELTSPTFIVQNLEPAAQVVAVAPGSDPTLWAWSIAAPNTPGLHILALTVYLGDNPNPVWIRTFQLEVISSTALATPTPLPLIDRPGAVAVLGAVATIIAALIGLLGVLIGKGYVPFIPTKAGRQRRLQILKRNLEHLKEQAALYGPLDVPIGLANQLRLTEKEIADLEEQKEKS